MRDWIDRLHGGPHAELVATFDTRVGRVRHMPGSAAKAAARALRKHGYSIMARPESFFVDDVAGPLFDGELERATAWGEQLAVKLRQRAPTK